MYKELSHFSGLRCIEAAVRHQSYSKAADELNVSQAAVSQQIRLMEEQLETKLFYRQGRNMLPTTQGKKLAASLSQGFDVLAKGLRSIRSEPVQGTLTVTTTQSFASMVLMPRLWKFSLHNPGVVVRVLASAELENLQQGEVDIAIRYGFGEFPQFKQITIFEDKVYPLCSPQLAQDVDLTDMQNLQHCWLVNYTYYNFWQQWFEQAGLKFDTEHNAEHNKWLEVSNMDMALSAVMAGHGIFLGSEKQARYYLEHGMLLKPYDIGLSPGVRYSMLYNEESPRIKRIQVFKDWLMTELQEL